MSPSAQLPCGLLAGGLVCALGACDVPVPTPPFALDPAVSPSFACNAGDAPNAARQTRVVLRPAGTVGFSLAARASLDGVTAAIPAVSLLSAAGREIPLRSVELATPGEMALWVTGTTDGGRPLAPGDYTVLVRTNDQLAATARGALHVVAPPAVTAVATLGVAPGPAAACAGGGSRLRLSGRGFRAGAVTVALIRAGAAPVAVPEASVSVPSGEALEFDAPAGLALGRYGVRIISHDGERNLTATDPLAAWPRGCEATLPDAFEVVPSPALTAVEGADRCADGTVTVAVRGEQLREGDPFTLGEALVAPDRVALDQPAGDGTFRRATLTVSAVRLRGVSPYPVVVRSRGGCTAAVSPVCPAGSDRDARGLCARNEAGTVALSLPPGTPVEPPRVDSIVAPRACAQGPLAVLVRGANLFGAPRVTIGGAVARDVTADGAGALVAEFDVDEAWVRTAGPRELRVASTAACGTGASVMVSSAPAVGFDSVTPARVCLGDDPATVTLRGVGLGAVREVTVGGLAARADRAGDDALWVTVPAGVSTGVSLDIAVGPDDACAPPRRSLRVDAPARIERVFALRACADAEPVAVALGENLREDLALTLDGAPVPPERIVRGSDRVLRVALPAGFAEGAHDLGWNGGDGCVGGSATFAWSPQGDASIDATTPATVSQVAPGRVRIEGPRAASFGAFSLVEAGPGRAALLLTEVTPLDADTVVATVAGAMPGGPYTLEASEGRCRATRPAVVTVVPARGLTVSRVVPSIVERGRPTRVVVTGVGWTAPPRLRLHREGTSFEVAPIALAAGRVAFDVPTSLAVGAYGLSVGGDGGAGVIVADALRVAARVPRVDAVIPAPVSGARLTFAVFGEGFVEPRVSLRFPAEDLPATRVRWSPNLAVASLETPLLAAGTWPVRVTNADGSFGDGGGVHVGDRASFCAADGVPALTAARRGHGVVAYETVDGARHLLAIGGDGGPGTPARDDVELASVEADGGLGPWRVQRERLPAPRTGVTHAAFAHGGFVYVVGGNGTNGLAVDTVWRAAILDTAPRPTVQAEARSVASGGLAPGVWLYRVAAVTGTTTSAESVASVPVAARCEGRCAVALRWAPVAGAVRYRVFRSATADGDARDLVAVTSVDAAGWVDDGAAFPTGADANARPLDPGSVGPWQAVGARLLAARTGAAAAMVRGTDDRWLLVVAGGRSDALRDDIERSEWSVERNEPGPFALDAHRMVRPQDELTALAVTQADAPWALWASQLLLVGGRDAEGNPAPFESALVTEGAALVGWRSFAAAPRAGGLATVTRASVFTFGGVGAGAEAVCRAPLDVWGAAGPFACAAGNLATTRRGAALTRIGTEVFLVGGTDGGAAVTEVVRCTP
ncbi:MAG: hypothetical protein U0324_07505 [Polyangiales bacterium]